MISLGRPPGSYRLGALFKRACFLVSLYLPQQMSVVLQCNSDGWMIRWEHFLYDRQRSLVERFSFCIFPLIVVEPCQVMEGSGGVRGIRREGFLFGCQGLLVKVFCLLV